MPFRAASGREWVIVNPDSTQSGMAESVMRQGAMQQQQPIAAPLAAACGTAPIAAASAAERRLADGNFILPQAPTPLAFTGERMTTAMDGQIALEHYHRYCLARDLCVDRDVLDVASGEGYGAALLAGVARSVVGVEIDQASVDHARHAYRQPNLRFLAGDAAELPLADASVDVVVSFETLEHVRDQQAFLAQVRRVLRPGGLFVVSTPDRLVYSAPGQPANPYHVLELTDQEFAALLGRHFAHHRILAQRVMVGSLVAPKATTGDPWRSYERRAADIVEAQTGLSRAVYLIAAASDRPLPPLGPSVYAHNALVDELFAAQAAHGWLAAEKERLGQALKTAEDAAVAERLRLEQALVAVREEAQADAERLRQALEAAHRQVQEAQVRIGQGAGGLPRKAVTVAADGREQERLRLALETLQEAAQASERHFGARLAQAQADVAAAEKRCRKMRKSFSWRMTRPLRAAVGLVRGKNKKNKAKSAAAPLRLDMPAVPPLSVRFDRRSAFEVLHGRVPIYFPPLAAPEVSVIIPAYQGLPDLLNCLRSLSLHRATEPAFEVILVDDCPAAPVLHAIPVSGGLVRIANAENLGFLLSCNKGAAEARGRVLCFLNSDTIVSAGWLAALVEALDSSPRAALAGGMLLNQDGSIQDVGWRILDNGWGHPLGRGGDARDGAYTYRRRVDCVGGACFAVPRAVWDDLGGFDVAYAPAYYEEFDLAFRAKAKGLEVIYEPKSEVIHLGAASYGAERRDQLSSINHAKFCRRFAELLRRQPADVGDEFAIISAGATRPVIVVVDYGVPQPDRHAGDVTIAAYLGMLVAAGWRVVFAPDDGIAEGPPADALEAQGIELIRAPATLAGWLARHGRHVAAVWISRPAIAEPLLPLFRSFTDARIAYYTHDLHHLRLQREADLRGDPALAETARVARDQEVGVLRAVDHVMTPSAEEGEIIQGLAPGIPVTALPPYYYESDAIVAGDAAHFAPLVDILFVGGFPHTPNVDAALFIANEVMPLVWEQRPEARLLLVGYAPPDEVRALAGPRVVVTGQVPDLEPYFASARLMLAALRYGAGVKGKVVQAMRYGVPVVATGVGAEGIGITAGEQALIAEDAAGLAAAVCALLADAERCQALSRAGAALIAERFSRAAARVALDAVFRTPRCAVCGSARLLAVPASDNQREAFVCRDCFALGRTEALARVMVRRLARDGETTLPELMDRRPDLRVHELGFVGGIAETLRGLPNYSVSEFFPDVPLGSLGPVGVRCEDVSRLSFADASFDAVVSQDVLEHVPDPVRGIAETARVLRPGGAHFFTVPDDPTRPRSVTRARLGDAGAVEHLLPPEYHGDPVRSEGALVFTDYGADLAELVAAAGLVLVTHEQPMRGRDGGAPARIFEAVKPRQPLPEVTRPAALRLADLQDRSGIFETLIGQFYRAEVAEAATVIDGGANYGMHTGPLAGLVGRGGRVYAFEPLPIAAQALRSMFAAETQVIIREKALGERPERKTFYHVVNDAALSSLLDRDISFAYPDLEIRQIEVDCVTLDSLADEPVSFIKLDLEGFDFLALRAGRRLLVQQRPLVVFECGRRDAAVPAGYTADDFFALFAQVDYVLFDLFGRPFGPAEFDLPWNAREMPHYVVAVPATRTDIALKLRRRAWAVLIGEGIDPADC